MPIEYDPSREALFTPERRETVFERDQTYSPLQIAVEAARLAYYRAEISEPEKARLTEALERVGFTDLELFVDAASGGAAFAARRAADGTALLAFRGTQPDNLKNLVTDAEASPVEWTESSGHVHSGFAGAARALLPQIHQWLKSTNPDPTKLLFAGHSLGAALATLTATTCHPAWLVTLGSPRVGDAEFAVTVHATQSVRFVDCCDAITEVPPPIGGYVHIAPSTYLTADGRVIEKPADEFVAEDRHRARESYARQFAWELTREVLFRELADHAPINYARALFS
jgi:hypothetical protein